ncbi:hypothetical protein B296_00049280 [Ensete ventricosum]|uniref:Uncharacterized protein n=1 Tax=Ensete ventricosum TaxID=4639 RepID=A0A426YRD1_ENSVE|nr:hypothetical protein B296_00049280 [Ensete ventricosum]
MRLLDRHYSPIQPPLHPSRPSNMLNLLYTSVAYGTYPFHAEEKVSMLLGAKFWYLVMATNTPLSAYKSLHEYQILQVSNSPHLCELCITLSFVAQHIPLCTVSIFMKHLACLEHRQVYLPR